MTKTSPGECHFLVWSSLAAFSCRAAARALRSNSTAGTSGAGGGKSGGGNGLPRSDKSNTGGGPSGGHFPLAPRGRRLDNSCLPPPVTKALPWSRTFDMTPSAMGAATPKGPDGSASPSNSTTAAASVFRSLRERPPTLPGRAPTGGTARLAGGLHVPPGAWSPSESEWSAKSAPS